VVKFERWRLGKAGHSSVIRNLTFGGFNKRFAPNRTAFDWLSRDNAEVDAYIADPFCGFDCSTQFWLDLLEALPKLAEPAHRKRVPESLPVLIMSGDRDPVGANLSELIGAYKGAGLGRLSVKFYPDARHETLNETNRLEVMNDLAAWLEKEFPRL
jgi:alpha-beta hydrolase superfamily lysophospholipase